MTDDNKAFWGKEVLGSLFRHRENARFTYGAFYVQEEKLRNNIFYSQVALAIAGVAISAFDLKFGQGNYVGWAVGAAGTGIAAVEKVIGAEANKVHDIGARWHDLYDDMTALRDNVGTNPNYDRQLFQQQVMNFGEHKKRLKQLSPPTDEKSYQLSRVRLNSWWYKTEKQAHQSFGWDPTIVPDN